MYSLRKAASITLSVWNALFLREALTRLFSSRGAWFWLFFEPVFHIAYLMVLFSVVRVRSIGGFETAIWIMVGMVGFFMFRRTGIQVLNAINANQALFAYRQVKPIDTLLVRGVLEGMMMVLIAAILFMVSALLGYSVIPDDALIVLVAFWGLWLLGMGYGLVSSVVTKLVPDLKSIFNLIMMPMYIISGVIFPLSAVPMPYRDWLMLNPVAHGLEAVRLGFASTYYAVPGLSMSYMFGFALVSIFLGLALHYRYAIKLVTQ